MRPEPTSCESKYYLWKLWRILKLCNNLTFLSWYAESIDKIIDSTNDCIDLIIKKKGNRIKY